EMRHDWDGIIAQFMREALPGVSAPRRKRTGQLMMTTLTTAGEHLSRGTLPEKEIRAYGEAMADMFCAYLDSL
ncbi:TetR family transcriptional regulator, partial [Klebsiella pneumoniae]